MDRTATPRGRGGGGSRGYVASNRYSVLMNGGTGGFDSPGEERNVRGSGEQVSGRGRGESGDVRGRDTTGGKRTLEDRSPGSVVEQRNTRNRANRRSEEEQVSGVRDDRGTEFTVIDEVGGEESIMEDEEQEATDEVRRRERQEEEERDRQRRERAARDRENRMNEFDLGEVFRRIDDRMVKELDELTGNEQDEVSKKVRAGLMVIMDGIRDVMSTVSDSVANERLDRRLEEAKVSDRIDKVSEEIVVLKRAADNWAGEESVNKIKESEREMEKKVKAAGCQLKLLDIDFGYASDDKKEMVRQVVSMLRGDINPTDRSRFDRILRRTRIILMGKRTEVRRERNRNIHTIPVLLEMQNRIDTEEAEVLLKAAGYFPTFHWPTEMVDFVAGAREELRKVGYGESHYIRIRPEERGGEIQIRADVKLKNGGRFVPKAFWKCPPLQREFWALITGLFEPRLVGQPER
jgi:hypothetical protein